MVKNDREKDLDAMKRRVSAQRSLAPVVPLRVKKWTDARTTGHTRPARVRVVAAVVALVVDVAVRPAHYGTKPGHTKTSMSHFPTSEGVSEVSERANE